MADYKDLLDSLIGKTKEIVTSDTVTDLVGKVKDAAESTGIRDVYEKGANRAKAFGSATKRTLELREAYTERERVFAEIGKLFYEQCEEAPDAFYAALFQQLETIDADIAAKKAEVDAYKAQFGAKEEEAAAEKDIEVEIMDFEDIVNSTAADGSGEKNS